MIRKYVLLLAALFLLPAASFADWRQEVAPLFSKTPDYKAAVDLLTLRLSSIDDVDKRTVAGLLAYSYDRLGDKASAYKWLGDYFETYGWSTAYYDFLELQSYSSVTAYLRGWLIRYPLSKEIALVEAAYPEDTPLPTTQVVVINMVNEALFKFSDADGVVKAGLLRRGYNAIELPMRVLFMGTGSREYTLELKTGDLIVKKDITVTVSIQSRTIIQKKEEEARNQEYVLSLFIGGKLAAVSKKSLPYNPPVHFERPTPTGQFQPFGPRDPTGRTSGLANSFPILAIPMAISELLKALKGKKKPEEIPYKKSSEITLTYRQRNIDGSLEAIKAALSIRTVNLKVVSSSGP